MALFRNPILFSAHFGIDPSVLNQAGLMDPFLDVDTQLFIDPVLLAKSQNSLISIDGIEKFREHFSKFVRLLAISQNVGDAPWKAAWMLLDLREPPENGLGYGGSGTSGSSRPDTIRDAMMKTAQQIIQLGSNDPELISLMGFFEEKVGPDTISDFTTRVISPVLGAITEEFCSENGIAVYDIDGLRLPRYTTMDGKEKHILLVPQDIVRDLPVANDWSGIEKAAFENQQIRNRVNLLLGGLAKTTVKDRKAALKRSALESSESFDQFLSSVKEHTESYDPAIDSLGYYKLKAVLSADVRQLITVDEFNLEEGPKAIADVVRKTLELFRHHVENGNLWEELWLGDKPKKERAAQLIYFALADCFCQANDIDISPEANMGGGPVDFKFSKGYRARVLVEMKRCSGTVVHGYEKQLEIYKEASRTNFGFFVVIDHGSLGDKLRRIEAIKKQRLLDGELASEIFVIDARKKDSASKRKG